MKANLTKLEARSSKLKKDSKDPMPNAAVARRRRVGAWSALSLGFLLSLVLGAWCFRAGAGIPEPATVFYGQIVNRASGQIYLHTNGTLVWRILPRTGGPAMTFRTELEPLGNGQFSYRLELPHEAAAYGLETTSVSTVPLTENPSDFQHLDISLAGRPVRLLAPASQYFQASQLTRAATFRVDLETVSALPDTDGDGLPDWWEERHGLDRFFAGDARGDRDSDGKSNFNEFQDGTDPNHDDRAPTLETERIFVSESATVAVVLRALDSDSPPADLRYTLTRPPAGGTLYLRNSIAATNGPATDRALAANDRFSQADADGGRLLFRHESLAAQTINFEVTLSDEIALHPTFTGTVSVVVYRPSASDGSGAKVWLDAHQLAQSSQNLIPGSATPRWLDRSGHHFDAVSVSGLAPVFETNSPGGRNSLALDAQPWDLSSWNESELLPQTARTVVAVFKATGDSPQQVLSTPRFELGLTAAEDPNQPGRVRYATENSATYSRQSLRGDWTVATISEENQQAQLEVNGVWSGAPSPLNETTALAVKPTVGGKTVGHYDPNTRAWQFEQRDPFSGQIAEILAFDEALDARTRQQVNYHLLSKWFGYVLCDGSRETHAVKITVPSAGLTPAQYASNYVALYGRDRSHILLGGVGSDEISAGMEDDIVAGGPGDDLLTGGGGRDLFVFNPGDGNDTITDFSTSEGDAIDLSYLLNGASRNLTDYVQLNNVGPDSWLRISVGGHGTNYSDMTIKLANNVLRQSDLQFLWANGYLITGGIGLEGPAWVNVTATQPNAGEEGPTAGRFVVSRTGGTDAALTVSLAIGGSAINGTDYSPIAPQITFAPGQSSVTVAVTPYSDSLVEGSEVVELLVQPGTGYNVGPSGRAQVTIADLPERYSIETVEAVAARIGPVPGYCLIHRSGMLDRSTVVRLGLGGSAVNGLDYQRISPLLAFAPGQSAAIISVTPLANRPVLATPKTVEVRVLSDPNSVYLTGLPVSARIYLVEELMDFDLWRAQQLPEATEESALLAGLDPDRDGLPNLVEYAFGLDPNQADSAEARSVLPQARVRDGHLTIEFRKRVAAVDLEYTVEVSDDLRTWRAGGREFEEISIPEFSARPEMVVLREGTPIRTAPQRYLRVKVGIRE
jgi:hypothetical protein